MVQFFSQLLENTVAHSQQCLRTSYDFNIQILYTDLDTFSSRLS